MNFMLDSYYTIGRMHRFCQDYVVQGLEPFPHLILADGCSASPNSDLGARLLVLNARQMLPRFVSAADASERLADHWRLGRRIVRRAARQSRILGLSDGILDATLLVAWCDGATVHIHLYGDGCIAVRRADGGIATLQVEYAENAPYYLSYLLHPQRWLFYQEAIGDPALAQSVSYQNEAGETTRREPFDTPSVFSFDLAAFPVVAVATDGLDSFVDAETSQKLNLLTVAQEMLDFRNLDGAFVQRRLRETLIEYSQRRVYCCDDIGFGAFVTIDDQAAHPSPMSSLLKSARGI